MDQKAAIEYLATLNDLSLNRTLYKFGRACYRVVAKDFGAVPGIEHIAGYDKFNRFAPAKPHQIEPRSTKLWSKTASAKAIPDPWADAAKIFGL